MADLYENELFFLHAIRFCINANIPGYHEIRLLLCRHFGITKPSCVDHVRDSQ